MARRGPLILAATVALAPAVLMVWRVKHDHAVTQAADPGRGASDDTPDDRRTVSAEHSGVRRKQRPPRLLAPERTDASPRSAAHAMEQQMQAALFPQLRVALKKCFAGVELGLPAGAHEARFTVNVEVRTDGGEGRVVSIPSVEASTGRMPERAESCLRALFTEAAPFRSDIEFDGTVALPLAIHQEARATAEESATPP